MNLDDYILGKDDTTNPASPYYTGIVEEEEEELDICDSCLEVDEVFPASDVATRKPVCICENCSKCLDDILT